MRLEIPGYVRWASNGLGGPALAYGPRCCRVIPGCSVSGRWRRSLAEIPGQTPADRVSLPTPVRSGRDGNAGAGQAAAGGVLR